MAYALQPDPADPLTPAHGSTETRAADGYQVSPDPVLAEQAPSIAPAELPHSYGFDSLHLMPSDPCTAFAVWDLDWSAAFGGATPAERKVHLRLLNDSGAEEARVEIEPAARTCSVKVPRAGVAYRAEIGYFAPDGQWTSFALSAPVRMPSEGFSESDDSAEYATVPFHLSFQRMVDSLSSGAKQEQPPLTTMLSELREHVMTRSDFPKLSRGKEEILRAISESVAKAPAGAPRPSISPRKWSSQKLQAILGFGGTSPARGFGGTSLHS